MLSACALILTLFSSHVCCKACLVNQIAERPLEPLSCHKVTLIPAEGVVICRANKVHFRGLEEHTTDQRMEVKKCTVHNDKESGLFCETCNEVICSDCAHQGQMHHEHTLQ